MRAPKRILAAIESENHWPYLIDKVVQLRDLSHAGLVFARSHFGSVVAESKPPLDARDYHWRETPKSRLGGYVDAMFVDPLLDSNREWTNRAFQGLIEAAHARDCQLIIKDAYIRHSVGRQLLHTPHDWPLLHHSDVPVMIVKPKRWIENAAVVAAVDVFDSQKKELNRHIVGYAYELCRLLGADLHLVNALPMLENAALHYGNADFSEWRDNLRRYRRQRLEQLVAEADAEVETIQVQIGSPWQVVADVVERTNAEFLVIGKVKPSVQSFLGTTSERLLHTVSADVVSVP